LESDSFVITGVPSTRPDWYEFEVVSNGVELGKVGSQAKSEFIKKMLAVLENRNGTKLGSIPRAQFKDIVGGDDAEYLGYVVLSGYNTFYFFKSGPETIHAVLADSEAQSLAHSQFDIHVFDLWQRQLKLQQGLVDSAR
jgi:hypothetical protein